MVPSPSGKLSKQKLSPNELAIMDALWTLREATGKQVLQQAGLQLAQTTLLTYLSRLETKGFVSRRPSGHGFVYSPAVPRISVAARLLDQVVQQFEGRLSSLVSHFVRTRELSPEERKRLREVVERLDQEP